MPSLVFNEGTITESATSLPIDFPASSELLSASPRTRTPRYSNYSNEARRFLWAGVLLLTAIIVVLWGWSMKLQFAAINWNSLPEKKLLENNSTDWNKIFAEREAARSEALAKDRVRLLLTELNALAASSSSATQTTTTATGTVR